MNTRSFFTLITAATAVTALAAGMLLAISAPVSADELSQAAVQSPALTSSLMGACEPA